MSFILHALVLEGIQTSRTTSPQHRGARPGSDFASGTHITIMIQNSSNSHKQLLGGVERNLRDDLEQPLPFPKKGN